MNLPLPSLALHSPTTPDQVGGTRTSQPTLILAGDDDPLVPLVNARILGALIPTARVHEYSGGDVELVADPHRLVPTIEDFLSSDDLAPPPIEGVRR
jgi:pimeloyl-ACP methyl ester carboxylesterase